MNAYAATARRIRQTAPVLSLAAALIVPNLLRHELRGVATDGVELAMVAAAVESVPYRIGDWVGRDIAIPEAARRLLRPNAMLSRRYVNLQSGTRLDLAIVHCGDSRDMLGHYPPICYPSNGWVSTARFTGEPHDGAQGDPIDLSMGETAVPSRLYHYSRAHSPSAGSNASHIRIFNFFVLPDGTLTRDIEDVGRQTTWLGARVQGVAQIQLLTDQNVHIDEAADAAAEILEGIGGLFDSLGVKQSGSAEKAMSGSEAASMKDGTTRNARFPGAFSCAEG